MHAVPKKKEAGEKKQNSSDLGLMPILTTREEQEALRRMKQNIEMAKHLLLEDLSEYEREHIKLAITNAQKAVENYQNIRKRGQTRKNIMGGLKGAAGFIVADYITGIGFGDDPALIFLGLAAIATLIFSRSPASQDVIVEAALRQTGRAIENLASAIETIFLTAAGNVIHDHILDEARQKAIGLGLAASAASVTHEILCKMLEKMANENNKRKKIISTMKGLKCRRSRHSG